MKWSEGKGFYFEKQGKPHWQRLGGIKETSHADVRRQQSREGMAKSFLSEMAGA